MYAVLDAAGSPFAVSEDAARRRTEHAGVVLTATNTLLGELAYDWSTPHGQQLRQVLSETFQHMIGGFGLSK